MINEVAEGSIRSATQLILSQSWNKKALQVGAAKTPIICMRRAPIVNIYYSTLTRPKHEEM
jgi:hypothetical protein